MRILIVTPRQPRTTGNWVTACRQKKGLEFLGHSVRIMETSESGEGLERVVEDFAPDAVNVLHALRSGVPWLACPSAQHVPWVVTLTGTDINGLYDTPRQRSDLLRVMKAAGAIITLTAAARRSISLSYPQWEGKLYHVAPGVTLGEEHDDLRKRLGISRNRVLFLHPAGLRPVKGNRELLEMFGRVASNRQTRLVFCGPILDAKYADGFFAALRRRPWAVYGGVIPVEAMASVLRAADVVLNNSCSEGFSTVLKEAAVLGVPVLARDIPGNREAFQLGRQGLLYHGPADFVRKARVLARHVTLRRGLSRAEPGAASWLDEALRLERICCRLAGGG